MIVNEYRLDLTSAAGAEAAARTGREVLLRRGRAAAARLRRAAGEVTARRAQRSSRARTGRRRFRLVLRARSPAAGRGVGDRVLAPRRIRADGARSGGRAARRRRARPPCGGAARRDLGADAHGAGARAPRRRARAAANPRAHLCIFGLYATLNRAAPGGRRGQRARPRLRAAARRARRVAGGRDDRVGPSRRARPAASLHWCRIAARCPALGKYARLAIAGERARRRPRRGDARAASTSAGTARSRPSTRAASSRCRPTSCWQMRARRSPRARGTSTSAIPTS